MEHVKTNQANVITKLPINQVEISNESKEIFDYEKKSATVSEIRKPISTTGIYPALFICRYQGKYIIVDGVLRYLALSSLNFNEIDCIILEAEPSSANELKDLIIRYNIKSVPTPSEKIKMFAHLLRLDDDSKLDNQTFEERAELISATNGKGWKRNNIFTFKNIYKWDKQNPENGLDLVERVVTGEISFDKAKIIVGFLNDPKSNYNLEKEKEGKILEKYIKKEITVTKAESLINQYNLKKDNGLTRLIPTEKLSAKDYLVLWGDSKQMTLPEDAEIDMIYTSPPYFKLINYGKTGEDDNKVFEIGQEPTVDDFCDNLVSVFVKGKKNLKDTGVIMVNLDSTYENCRNLRVMERFTAKMEEAGFIYIDEVIWYKSNAKPYQNSVKRFNHSYEKILLFGKSENFFYRQLRLYDPNKTAKVSKGCSEQGNKGLDFKSHNYHISNPYRTISNFINENEFEDIIKLHISHERSQQKGLQNGFFGSFPELLPIPFILSYTPENGTVFDPFGGTGTTGLASLLLGRKVIISELYEKNVAKIVETLERGISQFNNEYYNDLKKDLLNADTLGIVA
jgi:DNA modification methylase